MKNKSSNNDKNEPQSSPSASESEDIDESPKQETPKNEREEALQKLKERYNKTPKKEKSPEKSPEEKPKKKGRDWGTGKVTSKDMKELDLSKGTESIEDIKKEVNIGRSEMDIQDDEENHLSEEDDDDEEEDDNVNENKNSGWGFGFVSDFFKTISGNKILTDEDLEPVFEEMSKKLISKNVAHEVSTEICNSVRKSLVGQKLTSFTRYIIILF